MIEINWNPKDLLEYCPKKVTDEAEIYVKAVRNKIDRILFIVEILQEQKIPQGDKIEGRKIQLQTENNLESLAHNLHSLPDVLAHIVSVIIIRPLADSLGEPKLEPKGRKVNIQEIVSILTKIQTNASVEDFKKRYCLCLSNTITSLLTSNEYVYIDAFVNTIKHRHLINTEYKLHIENSRITDEGWSFLEFERDGTNYPKVHTNNLIDEHTKKIIKFIDQIGQDINNYCRAVYITKR